MSILWNKRINLWGEVDGSLLQKFTHHRNCHKFSTSCYKHNVKKEITVIDSHQSYTIKTLGNNMVDLFDRHGIELYHTDKVIPAIDTKLEDGMDIQIVRSFPVEITIGNESKSYYTTLLKVGAILKEANIELGPLDKVYPAIDRVIKGDRKIELVKVEKKILKAQMPVGYAIDVKRTNQLKSGVATIKTSGEYGQINEQIEVIVENGQEVSRQLLEWSYEEEPVAEILSKGKEKFLVLDDGTPYRYSKVMDMVATAYDLSYASCGKYPDHPQYGITFSGTKARPGVVAVDPRAIKLRSKLYVESLDRMPDYGFSSAEDTGSAIKTNRIDIFINDNAQAMRYGVRKVRVYVLEEEFDQSLMVGYSR